AERHALYALVVPAPLAARLAERWIVGDPALAARLGGAAPARAAPPLAATLALDADAPAALGLTTRLGARA
ncbi:MAG TPA: hypothetical protein VGD56_04390, partial [Gemmatirosa sp.]